MEYLQLQKQPPKGHLTSINEDAATVTDCINKCLDDVTKTITTHAKQKLWFIAEVHKLLKTREQEMKQHSEC